MPEPIDLSEMLMQQLLLDDGEVVLSLRAGDLYIIMASLQKAAIHQDLDPWLQQRVKTAARTIEQVLTERRPAAREVLAAGWTPTAFQDDEPPAGG